MLESRRLDGYRLCRLDAGPRNVLGPEAVAALAESLAPDPERPVVVLRGRTDAFCAGLDGRLLAAGGRPANALLAAMGQRLADVLAGPTRLITVCEGHAVAAGAMLLLVADHRIAVAGDYRIGFTEPGLGMPLPELPAVLARERLDRRHLHALTVGGEVVPPARAREAGFVDELVESADVDAAIAHAAASLGALDERAYLGTQRAVHGAAVERVEQLARSAEARVER